MMLQPIDFPLWVNGCQVCPSRNAFPIFTAVDLEMASDIAARLNREYYSAWRSVTAIGPIAGDPDHG